MGRNWNLEEKSGLCILRRPYKIHGEDPDANNSLSAILDMFMSFLFFVKSYSTYLPFCVCIYQLTQKYLEMIGSLFLRDILVHLCQ